MLLYLAPAGLGLLLGGSALLAVSVRVKVIWIVSALGVASGIALAVSAGSDEVWRTTRLGSSPGIIAGSAAACAWALVAVTDLGSGRWRSGLFVGVGASALALFATNQWLVPGLMFWSVSSIALVAAVHQNGRGPWSWLAIAASDGCLAAGLVGFALDSGAWEMPSPIEGWPFFAVVLAAVIRSGMIPSIGIWGALGSPGVAALPLLVGGSFALLAGLGARAQPWVAIVALIVSLACSVASIGLRRISLTFTGAWPVALALGAALIAPEAVAGAAVAAMLAVSAVAVWPMSSGRAGVERGVVLSFAPTTAGFGVIAVAAVAAFDRASAAESVAAAIPWTGAAALLPVALAAGVVMGIRVGRAATGHDYEPVAVAMTWALLAASVIIGVASRGSIGSGDAPLGPPGGVTRLYLLAVALGIGAAWLVQRLGRGVGSVVSDVTLESAFELTPPEVAGFWGPMLSSTAATLSIASVVLSAWLVIEGLSVGFL